MINPVTLYNEYIGESGRSKTTILFNFIEISHLCKSKNYIKVKLIYLCILVPRISWSKLVLIQNNIHGPPFQFLSCLENDFSNQHTIIHKLRHRFKTNEPICPVHCNLCGMNKMIKNKISAKLVKQRISMYRDYFWWMKICGKSLTFDACCDGWKRIYVIFWTISR